METPLRHLEQNLMLALGCQAHKDLVWVRGSITLLEIALTI